jgi:hypothetical protein
MTSKSKKRTEAYLIDAACEVAERSAKQANAIGYVAKIMVSASMPSRNPGKNEFTRHNGHTRLTIHAPSEIGIPYGTYPRMLLVWIVSEAKRNRSREVYLGESITDFLRNLGKIGSGGNTGSLKALREQSKRLFSSTITITSETKDRFEVENVSLAKSASVIWQPQQSSEWSATLLLTESFYEDICKRAVPIDLRVIQACSHYPLAIDIYCWLTYRNYGLRRPVVVTWKQLANQFGNVYSNHRHFKPKFLNALKRVSLFYPDATYLKTKRGLTLYPSPTHVPSSDDTSLFRVTL